MAVTKWKQYDEGRRVFWAINGQFAGGDFPPEGRIMNRNGGRHLNGAKFAGIWV
jgi:hypothetical protein